MIERFDMLRQFVGTIYSFNNEEWDAFEALWKPYEARRKEQLTLQGEHEHFLYFVTAGVQRVFYCDDMDREATLVFTYAPSFGGVLDAMLNSTPSKYYYETLTPSSFLRAGFNELQLLSKQVPAVEAMIKNGLTGALTGVLERLVEVQCYTSEQRFKKLLERSPHILQLVPHKYLASYLGIDATNFSKLINKVRI